MLEVDVVLVLGYDAISWHWVNINPRDFRTMGNPSFELYFSMTRRTFNLRLVDSLFGRALSLVTSSTEP